MKNFVARSTPWGTIQTGDLFADLAPREQKAVIAHEEGHIHHRHAWVRLKWILTTRAFRRYDAFLAMCEAQELEADKYAAEEGHADGLRWFLSGRNLHVKSDGYPTAMKRLEALRG